MLRWLFKKRGAAGAAPTAVVAKPVAPPSPATKAQQAEDVRTVWLPQLAAAQGDDAALLRLALATPLLDIKLAAVETLASEAALKQAEREFRSHDRRVHGAAKRRWLVKVAERETAAKAQALLAAAAGLLAETPVAANRLVALDRDWQALAPTLLDPADREAFVALRERLDGAVSAQAELQQHLKRWLADAPRALAELRAACVQAVASGGARGDAGGDAGGVALAKQAAQTLCESHPDTPAGREQAAAMQAAVLAATQVEARLDWLIALDAHQVEPPAELSPPSLPVEAVAQSAGSDETAAQPVPALGAEAGVQAGAGAAAEVALESALESASEPALEPAPAGLPDPAPRRPHMPSPAQRWRALPPVSDAALARALDERFEQWQRAQRPAALRAPRERAAPVVPRAPSAEQAQRLETLLQQAEAALADGQLAALEPPLQAIDSALAATRSVVWGDAVHTRHQALQAERARLKGWQQWGGGRARDDLLAEAETLARLTLAADDATSLDAPQLHLKSHGDSIQSLRQRWKALDRQGASASQPQWQAFDAALHEAYRPLAAQQALVKAARQDNLLAREALLTELEAVPLHDGAGDADDQAARWKEQLRALERFQLAWRPLGPLEHTVPAAARNPMQQRWRAALARLEQPLHEARRGAEAVREQFILRAEALVGGEAPAAAVRDAPAQVRQLQAEWQQHARQLPLARAVEGALWARFKAATDAVFAQREAAFEARDAELAANLAAREALLARVSALVDETDVRVVERTLAEVDRVWRQASDLPRGATAALEARYRDACVAAEQAAAARGRARWWTECDALVTKLGMCEAREAGATEGAEGADLASRWAALAVLPAAWEQALARRWAGPPVAVATSDLPLDDALLQLEMLLDLPGTAESLAARRELKLRAMKDALEGRGPGPQGPARQTEWLATALGRPAITPGQRQRLHAVLAALREAAPGTLTSSAVRG